LHPGHLYFLLEAKKYGDELIVVLAREETITEIKGKPKYSEKERKQHLEITGIPDEVVFGHLKDKYKIIEKIRGKYQVVMDVFYTSICTPILPSISW